MMLDLPFDLRQAKAPRHLITLSTPRFDVRFHLGQTGVIKVGDQLFTPRSGATLSNLENNTDGTPSNTEVSFIPAPFDPIKRKDAGSGKLRAATLTIEVCDLANLTLGKGVLQSGPAGNVREDHRTGKISMESRGGLALARGIDGDIIQVACRRIFGDDDCRIALIPADQTRGKSYVTFANATSVDKDGTGYACRVRTGSSGLPSDYANLFYEAQNAGTTDPTTQPAYPTLIGDTVLDGTVTFIARAAWVRYAQVDSIADNGFDIFLVDLPDARAVDGWYTRGRLYVRSPLERVDNCIQIANWINAELRVVSMFPVFGLVQAGDYIEILKDCDKTESACIFYNNIPNNSSERFIPGPDASMAFV